MSQESFRGCLIRAGSAGLLALALGGLISQMSWENYETNQRLREQENTEPHPGPNPTAIPQPTLPPDQPMPETAPFAIYPSLQEQQIDNCAAYPAGVRHRSTVCVNGQCDATFFGRRGPGIDTSWRVEWFDEDGRNHELSCEEVSRDAVVPDPNH